MAERRIGDELDRVRHELGELEELRELEQVTAELEESSPVRRSLSPRMSELQRELDHVGHDLTTAPNEQPAAGREPRACVRPDSRLPCLAVPCRKPTTRARRAAFTSSEPTAELTHGNPNDQHTVPELRRPARESRNRSTRRNADALNGGVDVDPNHRVDWHHLHRAADTPTSDLRALSSRSPRLPDLRVEGNEPTGDSPGRLDLPLLRDSRCRRSCALRTPEAQRGSSVPRLRQGVGLDPTVRGCPMSKMRACPTGRLTFEATPKRKVLAFGPWWRSWRVSSADPPAR